MMKYNRCGRSGVLLPAISLGLWHNFGSVDVFSTAEAIIKTAFDKGITHFDLANNYILYPDLLKKTSERSLAEISMVFSEISFYFY